MNYRHAYHAGNFADVFKHIVLLQLLDYLRQKEKRFVVLDTHAGSGLYDLHGEEARKTGEAEAGIGKLWDRRDAPPAVASYLAAVRGMTNGRKGELRHYPGSPLLIRSGLRAQDRLVANELHPADNRALRAALGGDDERLRVEQMDGYRLMKARLPPPERRGLVLVDPPFEAKDEFARLAQAMRDAWERWPTGMYALWYPVKDADAVRQFLAEIDTLAMPKLLCAEFLLRPPTGETFDGSGLVVVNPPWTLAATLAEAGPWLAAAFGGTARYVVRQAGRA